MKSIILLFFLTGFVLSGQTVVTIEDIQGQAASSPYDGQVVKTYGVVTGVFSSGFFMEMKPGGAWRGIYVYLGSAPSVSVGDSVEVTGTVDEYYSLTELTGNPTVNILGSSTPPPPVDVQSGPANDEQWEGVLIRVVDAVCESLQNAYGEWIVDDGSGNLMVDDMGVSFTPTVGDTYTITGPLTYTYGRYKIEPRDANDISGPLRFTFHTIYEIQGQTTVSPYIDSNVATTGIVTGVFNAGYFIEESPFIPWHGIYVYTNSAPGVSRGDSVIVMGSVSEYRGLTEISLFKDSVVSTGKHVPPYLTKADSVNLEAYEGLLVKVMDATVQDTGLAGSEFTIDDGSGLCKVDNWGVTLHPYPDDVMDLIGCIDVYNDTARMEPRDSADVNFHPMFRDISRTPLNPNFLQNVLIKARIIDNSQVLYDSLYYRVNSGVYTSIYHDSTRLDTFYFTIPRYNKGDTVHYYLLAEDDSSGVSTTSDFYYIVGDTGFIQFRVLTYNVLDFSGTSASARADDFEIVMRYINPDIVVVQELINEAGADTLLNRLNQAGIGTWSRAAFWDGPGTDNMLFYKNFIVSLVSQDTIIPPDGLRAMSEYVVDVNGSQLYIYSCHLKASTGYESQRFEEVQFLRQHIENLQSSKGDFEWLIVGDMNFYGSEGDSGYTEFIRPHALPDTNLGRSKDILGLPGYWHDNATFAPYHTQSTRSSSGGLDDRFDFIFSKYELDNDIGVDYVSNSYTTFGNDGDHLNLSVNDGTNNAVPDSIADVLYAFSDHLPVYADFRSTSPLGIHELPVFTCYPGDGWIGLNLFIGVDADVLIKKGKRVIYSGVAFDELRIKDYSPEKGLNRYTALVTYKDGFEERVVAETFYDEVIRVSAISGGIRISGGKSRNFMIFDITGRMIKGVQPEKNICDIRLRPGVYFVRLKDSGRTFKQVVF